MGLWRSQYDLHTTTNTDISSTQQYTCCFFISICEDRACACTCNCPVFGTALTYFVYVCVSGVENCNFLNLFLLLLLHWVDHCGIVLIWCFCVCLNGLILCLVAFNILSWSSKVNSNSFIWPPKKTACKYENMANNFNELYDKSGWFIARLWKTLNHTHSKFQ